MHRTHRRGEFVTGNVATRGPETETAPGAVLADRVREAATRLDPPTVSVPAPRSAEGVVPAPDLRSGKDAPAKELVAAVDALAEELEGDADDDTHRTVRRIAELVTDGVPDAGWSAHEGVEVDVLRATSVAARTLHEHTTSLLERLDADDRHASAALVDSVATTLRVVGVVADLEVMQRTGLQEPPAPTA
jgi:hypothetical protein